MKHTNDELDELRELHDHYVVAINVAVAEDNEVLVARLAADFDDEALALLAAPRAA